MIDDPSRNRGLNRASKRESFHHLDVGVENIIEELRSANSDLLLLRDKQIEPEDRLRQLEAGRRVSARKSVNDPAEANPRAPASPSHLRCSWAVPLVRRDWRPPYSWLAWDRLRGSR